MVGMLFDTGHRRFADRSEQHVLRVAGREEDHAHRVEVDGKPDRVPDGREDLADVQGGPEHLRDALQQSDAVLPPPLPVEQGDRLDERADQAAERCASARRGRRRTRPRRDSPRSARR